MLRPGRDRQFVYLFDTESGNLDLGAKSKLSERSRHDHDQVITITLEALMFLDPDDDVQVATGPLAARIGFRRRRLTLIRDPDGLAIGNAGGNLDLDATVDRNSPAPTAIHASVDDDGTTTATVLAGDHHAEHAAEAGLSNLARSTASLAGRGLGAGLGPGPGAGRANIQAGEGHLPGGPAQDLLEFEFDLGLEVESLDTGSSTATTASSTPAPEDLVEHREDVLRIHRAEVMAGS